MSNLATVPQSGSVSIEGLERVLLDGDLGGLSQQQRVEYYSRVCNTVGLNPLTQPFEYLKLQGKTILYARRACTDQLRQLHRVSVEIVSRERADDLYVVVARATTPDGRRDESLGAVPIKGLTGEALANALMKGETKAKRRVTLAICGLSMMDETEVSSLQPETRPAASTRPTLDTLSAEAGTTRPFSPAVPSAAAQPATDESATSAKPSLTNGPSTTPTPTQSTEVATDPAKLVDDHNALQYELGSESKTFDEHGLLEPTGECPVFGPDAAEARRGKRWDAYPGVIRALTQKPDWIASASHYQQRWAHYIVAARVCWKLANPEVKS